MSRRLTGLLATLALIALAVGLLWRPGSQPPNVLIIVVDTLREDHFSPQHMPRLHRTLTEWGVRYTRAWSISSWTPPAVATLMTGRVGIGEEPNLAIPDDFVTLAELARSQGYRTGLFSENTIIDQRSGGELGAVGYDQGFEMADMSGQPMLGPALGWVRGLAGGAPWLLYLQTMGVHDFHGAEAFDLDYDSILRWQGSCVESGPDDPECTEVSDRITAAYAAACRYEDGRLHDFIRALAAEGQLDNTIVIFTSDHGEGLGELDEAWDGTGAVQRRMGHGHQLWSESVRIPLVVAGGDLPAGQTDEGVISLRDLYPALASHLGWPLPDSVPPGRGFLTPHGPDAVLPLAVCLGTENPAWGVVQWPHKLVAWGEREAGFQLADPVFGQGSPAVRGDERLRGAQEQQVTARLRDTLLTPPGCEAMSAEMKERLRALGYVRGADEGDHSH